jgi:hypothetical protein
LNLQLSVYGAGSAIFPSLTPRMPMMKVISTAPFHGVNLGRVAAPVETTTLNFRHILEQHELCGKIQTP